MDENTENTAPFYRYLDILHTECIAVLASHPDVDPNIKGVLERAASLIYLHNEYKITNEVVKLAKQHVVDEVESKSAWYGW